LRLAHFRTTFPRNIQLYSGVFGVLGVALGAVGALASLRRLPLFVLTVPYIVISTLFFSLWTRPDPRYLAGGILLFTVLLVCGATVVAAAPEQLRRRGVPRPVVLGLVALALGLAIWGIGAPDAEDVSARPWATLALEGSLGLALVARALLPPGRGRAILPVGLALCLAVIVGWRTTSSFALRGSFQQEQVETAREVIESATGDRAVIFTTVEIGRPAENINFYTGASAIYLREITRWGVTPPYLMDQMVRAGFEAYLLLPPAAARRWIESDFIYPWFRPEMIADIPAHEARRWFVASPAHSGVPLWFVRMHRRPKRVPALPPS